MTARITGSKLKRRSLGIGPKRARIVVVDDHPTMREGLARVIDEAGDLIVCAQAESINRALELIETTHPDLAIVDITLGRQNGIELIKDLKSRHPKLPVTVQTYREHLKEKLQLKDGTSLVRFAVQWVEAQVQSPQANTA